MVFLTYLNYFSVNKVPAWVDVKESTIRGGGGNGGEQVFLILAAMLRRHCGYLGQSSGWRPEIRLTCAPQWARSRPTTPGYRSVGAGRSRNRPRRKPTIATTS